MRMKSLLVLVITLMFVPLAFSQEQKPTTNSSAAFPLPPLLDRPFTPRQAPEFSIAKGEPAILKSATETKKKDWVDHFNIGSRWFKRGAALTDGITTWRFLATPEYKPGYIYPRRGHGPNQYVYFANQNPYLPREAGFGKYIAGNRSKTGVLAYMTVANVAHDFGMEKLYKYLSRQKGWRRNLRIVVPALHTYFGVRHLQLAVAGQRARAHYLTSLKHMGLPTKGTPEGIRVPEEWRNLFNSSSLVGQCCVNVFIGTNPTSLFNPPSRR